jgi:hypothetical protein
MTTVGNRAGAVHLGIIRARILGVLDSSVTDDFPRLCYDLRPLGEVFFRCELLLALFTPAPPFPAFLSLVFPSVAFPSVALREAV